MSDHEQGAHARRISWFGLRWRLSAAWRWALAESAAYIIQAVSRVSWLRATPRLFVRPWEHALIDLRGRDLFDAEFYLAHHPDVRESSEDPLRHYLEFGWREGRPVNPQFDDGHYRAESGLVRGAPVSSLAHFLAFGRGSGLCPVPGISLMAHEAAEPGIAVARIDAYRHLVGSSNAVPAKTPLDLLEIYRRLEVLAPLDASAAVAVVMPIFLGHAETLNAICHVLEARSETPICLVVVNDASPEQALVMDLRTLAARGLLTLVEHEVNKGFVAAINRGSGKFPDLDVIWLNSDTEVFDGWIDRLRAGAYSEPRVATVTPLTNNGTICSYPRTNRDNPGLLELTWGELDLMAAQENRGQWFESPTAVGFATYVRRDALEVIGPLDEAAFGRGYGEENDFSQRAVTHGWKNLIAADVFVRHLGAMSFRGTRADRIEAALKVIDRRYPGYHAGVARFLDEDPLACARAALDRARLFRFSRDKNVLLISHSSGGGTQQHVAEEARRLKADNASVFLMTGGAGGQSTARLYHADAGPLPSLDQLSTADPALWDLLASLNLHEIHIHHLIDFGTEGPRIFLENLQRLGVPWRVTLHDYFPVCPRVTMSDRQGHFCGQPDDSGCRRCIERLGSRVGRPDISRWRDVHGELLEQACAVQVPDRDVEERIRSYFPWLRNMEVRAHEDPADLRPRVPRPRRPGPARIAIIGAIGPTKGFDVILETARYCRTHQPDVAFTVIGYTRDDHTARAAGIQVTGPYINSEVDGLIEKIDPDLVWIPSIWPETYSYTLSIALRSGRPVAAFAIGALGTRLEGVARATRIPIGLSRQPAEIWRRLDDAARPMVNSVIVDGD